MIDIKKYFRIFQMLPGAGTIPSSVSSRIWQTNLCLPLKKMGHEVISFSQNYDQFFVHAENPGWLKEHRTALSNKLLEELEQANLQRKIDFCFLYICDGFIEDEILEKIRNLGIPVLNYSCNNIHQFHLVEKISKVVDLNVFAERNARVKFEAIAANAIQMQMAANPDVYKPYDTDYKFDVTFVGQRYADRGSLAAFLIKNNINVQLFGPRWKADGEKVGNYTLSDRIDKLFSIVKEKGLFYTYRYLLSLASKIKTDRKEDRLLDGHVGGILSDEEMIKLFSESKINLGFSTVLEDAREGGKRMAHLRLRDFEIPMSGGFYLTQHTDELDYYFEVGKEIETYSNQSELLDKTRYYLTNNSSREKIKKAGLKRSLSEHTWQHRFNGLFKDEKFKALF